VLPASLTEWQPDSGDDMEPVWRYRQPWGCSAGRTAATSAGFQGSGSVWAYGLRYGRLVRLT
jgi:hypothetical protein